MKRNVMKDVKHQEKNIKIVVVRYKMKNKEIIKINKIIFTNKVVFFKF